MRFQHFLAVSDPDRAFAPTRDEVWKALVRRVHEPDAFVPGLTHFRILSYASQRIERELGFGQAIIRDIVFVDERSGALRFEVAETAAHAGGSLTIAIEETDGVIALRFSYGTTLESGGDAAGVDPVDYVKAAYAASDWDTVDVIRRTLGYERA